MSTELVMLSNHLILCSTPHFSLLLPLILPSSRIFFQWVGSLHQVVKLLELKHQSFQWIFRVDFLQDWLVGSPCSPRDSQKSSPTSQFKGINSLVIGFFFTVQFSHPHMTTGKTIALTIWTYAGKVMSLFLFNTVSRFIMEMEIATHSSILAGRIPWTKELVCYQP